MLHLLLLVLLLSPTLLLAQDVKLPPVIVTATRAHTTFPESPRNVSVIDKKDIENAPVHSVHELLDYALGVDVTPRGVRGTQADVSVRGSTFEQVAILIDGVRVNDAQTGHHTLDIPLGVLDVERIEILRGHGSSLYGPNAFGGVINIITKRPEKRHATFYHTYGEHGAINTSALLSFKGQNLGTSLSFEQMRHSGYRDGPDKSRIWDVSSKSRLKLPFGPANILFGLSRKDFGADSFYGKFDSRESTETELFYISQSFEGTNLILEPRVYLKRHYDKYTLLEHNPDYYQNRHRKWFYGGEIQATTPLGHKGGLVLGGEWREERIKSEGKGTYYDAIPLDRRGLGRHLDHRQAIYGEVNTSFLQRKVLLNAGLRGDRHSDYGWEWCPTAALGYLFTQGFKFSMSVGRSFRAPTFTDLYYYDPRNRGNPNLKPETAISYEFGLEYKRKYVSSGISFFRREGDNFIDWVWNPEHGAYVAQNIGGVNINGLELSLRFNTKPVPFTVEYTYMDSNMKRVKYTHIRHKLCAGIDIPLPFGLSSFVRGRYEDKLYGDSYFLLDAKVAKDIRGFQFFTEATNLFDRRYEELQGIPMPGRWVQGGIRWGIDY
jgi:vitamin B12 transporter